MEAHPNHPDFENHLLAGGEYLREGRVEDAQGEFEKALELSPGHSKALGLLGLVHFRRGSFANALLVYEQLAELHPDDASNWLNLGLVRLKLGDAQKAIVELNRSRTLDPSQIRTVSYLGLAYARNGDYAFAYEAFLLANQTELAQEMEQHLSPRERKAIADRVSENQSSGTFTAIGEDAGPARGASLRRGSNPVDEARSPQTKALASSVSPAQSAPSQAPAQKIDVDNDDTEADVFEFALPTDISFMSDEVAEPPPVPPAKAGTKRALSSAQAETPPLPAKAGAVATSPLGKAPQLIAEFAAANQVNLKGGKHYLMLSAGGLLIIQTKGRMVTRRDGVVVESGKLKFSPAMRRVRGANSNVPLGHVDRPLCRVQGIGELIVSPRGEHFAVFALDQDAVYLREGLVYAFDEDLSWECGRIPGSDEKGQTLQFRGRGTIALRSRVPLVSLNLDGQAMQVAEPVLAGWIGRVVPRVVSQKKNEDDELWVECSGEGTILVADKRPDPP